MRRIVAVFGVFVAAVAMSIGGASVASADDITVQNAAIGLWAAPGFVGPVVPQVLPTGVCQPLTILAPGSIANTGNGDVDFFSNATCTGVAPRTLISGADDGNTTALILVAAIST